jgi:hypothetical protein
VEDVALKVRGNIREEDVLRGAVFSRDTRLEPGEDVKFGGKGDTFVEIFGIAARPEEAFPSGALETFYIHATAMENGFIIFAEVFANDAHEIYGCEEAGRDGKICGRAAERAIHFAVRAFEGIIGYGTNHE